MEKNGVVVGVNSSDFASVHYTHVVSSQRDCLASPRQASRQMIRSTMSSSRYVSHLPRQTQTEN